MCRKCKLLRSIWWSKAKQVNMDLLDSGRYHILCYEISSSHKALYYQSQKHSKGV